MLHSIFHEVIPKRPVTALLGKQPEVLSKIQFQLFTAIMTAAKKTIAGAWRTKQLSIDITKRKIDWIMSQEKLTSILLDSHGKFVLAWTPWLEYRYGTDGHVALLSI
ncbi:hypothetical protein XELAEV_18014697mg [Xenopus laevis]|uniref:Uncharacterized protein n=1 Tax=Xenopus laevis TaxID=8355 RepID=A0A974HV81_XENLA|nr:hypothetical protein XELAEV_18014697mg [Xenopus laevis]